MEASELPVSPPRSVGEPGVEEARAALLAARSVATRSGRAARGNVARAALAVWGVVWLLGYAGVQFLPFGLAWALWVPLGTAAYALVRYWGREETVRSGWEAVFLRAWWVMMFGTTAIMLIVIPAPFAVVALLPGALWGLAILLYAVVADDRALALLGGTIVLAAPLLRMGVPDWSPLLFGLIGGCGMLALGVIRARSPWR